MTFAVRSVADLRIGDIGFASITGRVGAGVLAGQTGIDLAALLRGRRVENAGWITHAYVVVDVVHEAGWHADVVEAMPRGARAWRLWETERCDAGHAYARLPLTDAQRGGVAAAAREMALTRVPYGFAQYAAIAGLTVLGGDTASPRGPLAGYVQRRRTDGMPRRAICSQLVDEAYRQAGVHLFDDGRPPAYVTPGALFWQASRLGQVWVC